MESFNNILDKKHAEIMILYQNKLTKNKKMTSDVNKLDYYSNKTLNSINVAIDKKLKSSKAYQKKLEIELLQKSI